jgi:hypothetical protein
MRKEKRSFKNHNDEIMKKLHIPEFILRIHQTLLLECLEYYIVFEADALLKFETNLTGKVENVSAPLSNKENNTTLSKFTKLIQM